MKLSVVIPNFYVERLSNLREIIASIQTGSLWPDEIIIWNNLDAQPIAFPGLKPEVLVVQSPRNVGSQARLLAAMMARGEWVLFLDNDTAVRRRTIENLVVHADRYANVDAVMTLEGREFIQGVPYARWPKVYGHGLKSPRNVYLTLGRGEIVRRRVLNRVIGSFPFDERTQMDDLHLSDAYDRSGVPVLVVPCEKGFSDLHDISMGGVGMCKDANWNARRDEVARAIREEGLS